MKYKVEGSQHTFPPFLRNRILPPITYYLLLFTFYL